MSPTQVVETSVTTNNSPYEDYTNLDDQITTNTTLCCIYQLYGHYNIDFEDESPTQVVETSVTTNNSPSQDYTNKDDQLATNSHCTIFCSNEGLMLETSATHHTSQAKKHTIPTLVDQIHIFSLLTIHR